MITLGGDAELELVDTLDPFSEGIVFRCMRVLRYTGRAAPAQFPSDLPYQSSAPLRLWRGLKKGGVVSRRQHREQRRRAVCVAQMGVNFRKSSGTMPL